MRANTGSAWHADLVRRLFIPVGWFITSANGNVYICTATAGSGQQASMSTPPVQVIPGELQNDGCNTFEYLHDGAGIVRIDAVTDSTTRQRQTVLANLPVGRPARLDPAPFRGAPTAINTAGRAPGRARSRSAWWRAGRASNLDYARSLTRTAGFYPDHEDFHPGLGTGLVVDTDALRRRLGDDGAEILWTRTATFLLCGTASAEYIVSGGLFGEPITPATIVCRELSDFGSEDVYPAKTHKGITFAS